VSDHVRAIDLVFHNGRAGEVYNVGSDHDFSNREVVDILLSLTGQTADAIEFVSDRLGHDFRYAINASKIEAELGWTPKVAFEAGLRALVNTNW
jgi:dTDP-glucose 4,6-dehydratase